MQELPNWILAFATLALVAATFVLARYTKVLAALTRELVSVEKKRDEREASENRRTEIRRCLQLVEALRDIKPSDFTSKLKTGVTPAPAAQLIRDLALLAPRHIKDPDTLQHLQVLRQSIDNVQMGSSIGDNEGPIARALQLVQERADWSVTEWRNELQGSQ